MEPSREFDPNHRKNVVDSFVLEGLGTPLNYFWPMEVTRLGSLSDNDDSKGLSVDYALALFANRGGYNPTVYTRYYNPAVAGLVTPPHQLVKQNPIYLDPYLTKQYKELIISEGEGIDVMETQTLQKSVELNMPYAILAVGSVLINNGIITANTKIKRTFPTINRGAVLFHSQYYLPISALTDLYAAGG